MATETVAKPRTSMRAGVRKFGTFLSGMIMPNIGIFIAGGLVTALFFEKGRMPVPGILAPESIVLNGRATTRDAAIDEAGRLLLDRGAVDSDYLAAMHEREQSVSTYMGSYLAIPHGPNAAKDHIMQSAVSVVRYPDGIDWNGQEVRFVVGVAGMNNEHLKILSSIAMIFASKDQVARLEAATTVEEVLDLFGKVTS